MAGRRFLRPHGETPTKPPASIIALLLVLALGMLAHAQTLRRHTLTATRSKRYTATTTYVTPPPQSHLASLANATLATWARANQRQFVTEARQDLAHDTPFGPYFYQATPFYPRYLAPHLFSVGMLQEQYEGGAHPSTTRTTFNFALIDGRAKRLGLADFSTPNLGYRTEVQRLLLSKLHHDERAMFINDVKALSPDQLNRFLVEHDGLRFCFDPYAVGPYAAGPIEVKLTAQGLGPSFRLSLTK